MEFGFGFLLNIFRHNQPNFLYALTYLFAFTSICIHFYLHSLKWAFTLLWQGCVICLFFNLDLVEDSGMQNTRLSTLVEGSLQRFVRWLQNPWRRFSVIVISILFGNFLASAISTIAGQLAELDVLAAALVVGLTEVISWVAYRGDRTRRLERPRALFLEILNGLKIGGLYGLFLEAFKLGS